MTGLWKEPRGANPWAQRLVQRTDLLRELVVRDMKVRYKRAVLGMAWSLLNPLAQLLVYTFIFSHVVPLKVPNYDAFVLCGLLAWSWFHSSVYLGAESFTANRELIRSPGFSTALLPVVRVSADFIHFLVTLPLLLGLLALHGIFPTAAILLLPVVAALQFLLTLSLVYLLATANVPLRDTQHLVGIFLSLFFFVTPIVYAVQSVPARYEWLYQLNPLVPIIEGYRSILIHGTPPDPALLLRLIVFVLVLLPLSYLFFHRFSVRFSEEL